MSMMTTSGGPSRICYHKKLLPRVHAYGRGTGGGGWIRRQAVECWDSVKELYGMSPYGLVISLGKRPKKVYRWTPQGPVEVTEGGQGYARGTDSVPAMLTPGEAVLTPGAAEELGGGRVRKLNKRNPPNSRPKRTDGLMPQGIQGFAEGGYVDPFSGWTAYAPGYGGVEGGFLGNRGNPLNIFCETRGAAR